MGAKIFNPSIVLASVLSVVNIVIICLPGVYFARKGFVSRDMRRSLGHMSFNFLLPTLTFVNIGPQVTLSSLKLWWPAAVNIIVSRLVSLLTGWASSRMPWTKPEHRKIVIATSAFGNTNSALLMLVTAMCGQPALPFDKTMGGLCIKDGFAYVAIGLAASSFLTFPVAVQLLKPKQPKTLKEERDVESSPDSREGQAAVETAGKLEPVSECSRPMQAAHRATVSPFQHSSRARSNTLISAMSAPAAASVSPYPRSGFNSQMGAQALAWPGDDPRRQLGMESVQSFNAQKAMLAASGPAGGDDSQGGQTGSKELLPVKASEHCPNRGKEHFWMKVVRRASPPLRRMQESRAARVCRIGLSWVNKVMPPPTIASLSGVRPPLNAAPLAKIPASLVLSSRSNSVRRRQEQSTIQEGASANEPIPGNSEHDAAAESAKQGLVVGCIPFLKALMFPARGAPLGFLTTALDTIANAFVFLVSFILGAVLQRGPGPGTRSVGWGSVIMAVLNRFLFLPVLGAVWVLGTYKLGWWQQPDALFTFLLLMTNATPTGNQVQAVCAMYRTCEQECGAILFWQYMASLVGIPLWMALYLYLMAIFGMLG